MRVAMVGATGRFAHFVLDELVRRGEWVRALSRNPDRAAAARDTGAADAVVVDLTEPRTLRPALDGIDAVFHIGPGLDDREADMGTALVAAAREEGVSKFVFSGVIHPSISALSNHAAKLPTEEALYGSGLRFTVLQPARFMQTIAHYWAVDRDELWLPYAIGSPMSWVDYRDVAEVAATALTDSRYDYGTFELSSPGITSGVDMAAMLSDIVGRTVAAVHRPSTEYAARLPKEHRAAFVRMMRYYDRIGLPAGNAIVLQTLLNREPRTVRGFLTEMVSGVDESSERRVP